MFKQEWLRDLQDKLHKYQSKYEYTLITPDNATDIKNEFINIINNFRITYNLSIPQITYGRNSMFVTISDGQTIATIEFSAKFDNKGLTINSNK